MGKNTLLTLGFSTFFVNNSKSKKATGMSYTLKESPDAVVFISKRNCDASSYRFFVMSPNIPISVAILGSRSIDDVIDDVMRDLQY